MDPVELTLTSCISISSRKPMPAIKSSHLNPEDPHPMHNAPCSTRIRKIFRIGWEDRERSFLYPSTLCSNDLCQNGFNLSQGHAIEQRLTEGPSVESPIDLTIPGFRLFDLTSDCPINRKHRIPLVSEYLVHPIVPNLDYGHLEDGGSWLQKSFHLRRASSRGTH
ncbi:hypothetical protein B296_00017930 [Ensete ventricosum]|uniref:Uncharacterized protein n=1 Tax=Ensete ventricosum TaxID=4639 RepID=A0A426ZN78_ENSVE|nr:hypothetical protein B296_00017930 [Ensete ventricosum]